MVAKVLPAEDIDDFEEDDKDDESIVHTHRKV